MASLNSTSNAPMTRAGNGTAGSEAQMLDSPVGIFVDSNYDLYVADCGNDRVQMFRSGERNASTVVGNGTTGTIMLRQPMGVVMDGNGYLFIVDTGNHRVVGGGPSGYQCVAGCTGSSGASASQLSAPSSMAFDSGGNMFVMDKLNIRLQMFILSRNACGEFLFDKTSLTYSSLEHSVRCSRSFRP